MILTLCPSNPEPHNHQTQERVKLKINFTIMIEINDFQADREKDRWIDVFVFTGK